MGFYYNHITLVGRLTRDIELQEYSPSFQQIRLTLAVQRPFKSDAGKYDADFLPVLFNGKIALTANKLLSKGTPILVWGRAQSRQYEKNSQAMWITEIIAENFQILQKLKGHENDPAIQEALHSQ